MFQKKNAQTVAKGSEKLYSIVLQIRVPKAKNAERRMHKLQQNGEQRHIS